MTGRIATAPGKVVLSGEYAVLDGAPAISMAVDRRAAVRTCPEDAADGVREAGDTRLLDAVLAALGMPAPAPAVEQDTDAFYAPDGQGKRVKLGIGSSAALAVALCRYFAPPASADHAVFEAALAAHRDFQSGAGSGVDIATSFAGGVICYRMGDRLPVSSSWPRGLHYRLLWSGRPADTRARLRRYSRRRTQGSAAELRARSEAIADAWVAGATDRLLRDYREYVATLRRFDVDHGLGIFESGHDALAGRAQREGLVYKPCGAGGGDIGIALSADGEQLIRFVEEARGSGFAPLDIGLDARGAVAAGSGGE
jgi:phosphomevalonate kinase